MTGTLIVLLIAGIVVMFTLIIFRIESKDNLPMITVICPKCGEYEVGRRTDKPFNYCPACGSKVTKKESLK